MGTRITRQSPSILVALASCMALQMTGFAMVLPLFARRFDSFGAGVEALSVSDMAYALTFAFAAPFIGPQAGFLIAAALVILLTLASGLVLRLPEKVTHHISRAAVTR